jgi:iron-sulfur cluster assembly protein
MQLTNNQRLPSASKGTSSRSSSIMGISLTEKAAAHIGSYLGSRGKGVGIRLSVKTTGCSGLMYVLEPVDDPAPEDQLFNSQGIDVFVDPKSLIYIDGTEMDYVKQGLNEGFEFRNPNVQAECGCGESFTV